LDDHLLPERVSEFIPVALARELVFERFIARDLSVGDLVVELRQITQDGWIDVYEIALGHLGLRQEAALREMIQIVIGRGDDRMIDIQGRGRVVFAEVLCEHLGDGRFPDSSEDILDRLDRVLLRR
jgi:hypothetical protein